MKTLHDVEKSIKTMVRNTIALEVVASHVLKAGDGMVIKSWRPVAADWGKPETSRYPNFRGWRWEVYVAHDGAVMRTLYTQGTGYTEPPKMHDVMCCLVQDAMGAADAGFEEWAESFGFDTDSRKAEAIYRRCQRTYHDLVRVFGRDKLAELYRDDPEETCKVLFGKVATVRLRTTVQGLESHMLAHDAKTTEEQDDA